MGKAGLSGVRRKVDKCSSIRRRRTRPLVARAGYIMGVEERGTYILHHHMHTQKHSIDSSCSLLSSAALIYITADWPLLFLTGCTSHMHTGGIVMSHARVVSYYIIDCIQRGSIYAYRGIQPSSQIIMSRYTKNKLNFHMRPV